MGQVLEPRVMLSAEHVLQWGQTANTEALFNYSVYLSVSDKQKGGNQSKEGE